ncbi:hypothetical protein MHK_006034 [Candidatus Magnetomorum sp. HK-1]|nr:hypothetical protein MHK_006034 [Candidatus Magnetomorum sp. HK-1]
MKITYDQMIIILTIIGSIGLIITYFRVRKNSKKNDAE